ncbi:S-layer homology domain-containing protein [Saccharibacillus deserti]|uniref:S-layer homology domain-containing protein n=1 Tax=Saccharibacillus deserti TaxID=1634444 RepID=UPI001551E4A1|nr:S-layer homology domain-containing protein [Saccharibacillus deserti]
MNIGTPVPKRVGSSFVALLLAAGVLLPAASEASPVPASALETGVTTPVRISVTDAVTGLPLEEVKITLYWADTAANRAGGRLAGQPVSAAVAPGENGMGLRQVQPEGDYYIVGEKEGYLPYDSRNAGAAGILHAGEAVSSLYAFALTPEKHKYPAYMNGYTDGTFRPEQPVIRAELAVILQRTMSGEPAASDPDFRDIDSGKWLTTGVSVAAAKGWMQGTGGARFEPERAVTRAEMAQILANVYGWPDGSDKAFGDTEGHWAAAAIAAAASHGAMDGYPDGRFRPDRPVTRAETAALVNRLIERPADKGLPMTWSDVPPSYWAYGDVMAASIDHSPSRAR